MILSKAGKPLASKGFWVYLQLVFIRFGTIFTSKVYIFKTLSNPITTDVCMCVVCVSR